MEDREFTARFEPLPQHKIDALNKLKAYPSKTYWISDNRHDIHRQKEKIRKKIKSRKKRKKLYAKIQHEVKTWTSED